MGTLSHFWVIFIVGSHIAVASGSVVNLQVKEAGPTGLTINVSWLFARKFPSVDIIWDSVKYVSEPDMQVVTKPAGHRFLEEAPSEVSLSDNLRLDQQYRVCVSGQDRDCALQETLCAFVTVSRYNNVQKGPHLYLVLSSVHSKNVTITWSIVPKGPNSDAGPRTDIGYKLEWRRVDGRINGHPGHSSNIVSNTHIVKGLQPAIRYEICVGETLHGKDGQTCDFITTEEDLPGPPETDQSACHNQARGTHWRCDVIWMAPSKPNGKIIGYHVAWRDHEGYDLLESIPRGALCDPFCMDSQVLHFHPHEVCVRALTSKGYGWESCVQVADLSSRILALFELRVFIIIFVSIFTYTCGFRILKWIFRCSVRFLYRQLEQEKKHPV